ncbi:MAG: DUF885 domain-containing protein, partial [Gammaproteobacteria bacterium]|nr:DUF885 domain-containing protein [Gammaproteobacteria bacterium]
MRILIHSGLVAFLAMTVPAIADDDWVARSDANAQAVLEVMSKFSPEGAGRLGVDGLDEEIADLGPGIYERSLQATTGVLTELQQREALEKDPKVRQDLGILIKALEDNIRSSELRRDNMLPYYNIT